MNRRGFMSSILALAAAPAIVRADSLMRIVPRETTVALSEWLTVTPSTAFRLGDFVTFTGADNIRRGPFLIQEVKSGVMTLSKPYDGMTESEPYILFRRAS